MALKFNQNKSKKGPAPQPPTKLMQQKSLVDTKSITSDLTLSPDSVSTAVINWGPDWFSTAPEEILAMTAQRHFEETLALINKCEDYYAKDNTFYVAHETMEKVK